MEADDPVLGMMNDEEWEEPEEITVTLVDVAADLWWVTDVDDNSWLLPAYRFIGDDGGWYTCLLYTSPSPRDATLSRMPSSA